MKRYRFYIMSIIVAVMLSACDDNLDKQPLAELSDASFWQNEKDALAGLTAVYDALETNRGIFGWGQFGLYDMFTPVAHPRDGSRAAFARGTHDTTTDIARNVWGTSYKGIVRANDLLTNIDNIEMDADLAARMKAEARFLRAMFYYLLVEHFGDVPLFEIVPVIDNALDERAPKAEVIALIKQDIEFAINNLEIVYTGNEVGRATVGAALALRVKLALHEKDWSTAETAAEQIMGMDYELLENFPDLFTVENENGPETIFDIQHIWPDESENGGGFEKVYAPRGASASGWAWVQPTLFLIDKFEVIDPNPTYVQEDPRIPVEIYDYFEGRDPRMDWTVIRPGARFVDNTGEAKLHPYEMVNFNDTRTGMFARKYVLPGNNVSRSNQTPLNWMVFRYADILLNYLEVRAELDGGIASVSQTVLDNTINAVRARASDQLPLYIAGNITLDDLYDERMRELAFEGWLYTDMKRWGTIEMNDGFEVMGLEATSDAVQFRSAPIVTRTFDPSRHYLMPVPQSEIDINPNLTQNPGWQ